MRSRLKIIGLGEVLWDLLPKGKQLGGAPTNFAYMASLFGHQGIVASRVGDDELGGEIADRLHHLGLCADYLQRDPQHPTGSVAVTIDSRGQPEFRITDGVAWDFLSWTPDWEKLVGFGDVVCFGTLAQRSPTSRVTISRFLEALPSRVLKIFDVNLRQSYFNEEVLVASLRHADIVKLNHTELGIVASLVGLKPGQEEDRARQMLENYGLKLVCITRGEDGSLLVDDKSSSRHPGLRVAVADTVGAGDAFTACLAHYYLQGSSLDQINRTANRFAAWVASQHGGTPPFTSQTVEDILRHETISE